MVAIDRDVEAGRPGRVVEAGEEAIPPRSEPPTVEADPPPDAMILAGRASLGPTMVGRDRADRGIVPVAVASPGVIGEEVDGRDDVLLQEDRVAGEPQGRPEAGREVGVGPEAGGVEGRPGRARPEALDQRPDLVASRLNGGQEDGVGHPGAPTEGIEDLTQVVGPAPAREDDDEGLGHGEALGDIGGTRNDR